MNCPHCSHEWDQHVRGNCAECGCKWPQPVSPPPPPPPPTERQLLISRVEDVIWAALKNQDDIYVDRAMDTIDTSGWMGVNMTSVAAAIIDELGLGG